MTNLKITVSEKTLVRKVKNIIIIKQMTKGISHSQFVSHVPVVAIAVLPQQL